MSNWRGSTLDMVGMILSRDRDCCTEAAVNEEIKQGCR